ncbi:MAG: adaptor protein MecA [Lachnospiraceae bacterium]|nr:adaptor protein MecA [Lachnospiraceae bacterium]
MKIEKMNENQIRCTLTREDLANRELKISELAYGSEKAKNLFRDMMQQASYEFGFEAEDIPLMIEAIPINSECIVLIITKVEDPEELDTRFSKFAPSVHDESEKGLEEVIDGLSGAADEVLDLFKKIHETKKAINETENKPANDTANSPEPDKQTDSDMTRIFVFDSLNKLIRLSGILSESYRAENSLYKDERENQYLLVISKGGHTPSEFNRVCNVLSEYGIAKKFHQANRFYLEEHFAPLIASDALNALAKMN